MKVKILLLFIVFSSIVSAQNTNDKTIYLDSLWKETPKGNHTYYRVVKDYYSEREEYRFEDYFKSGKIQMEGNSLSKDNLSESGDFIYYYENGNKKTICSFETGTAIGKKTDWYQDVSKKMEGEYMVHEKQVPPLFKIYQFWDPKHIQKVIDGNGYFEDIDKDGSEEGKVTNGLKDGVWKGKRKLHQFSFNELYENGNFISGTGTDSLNVAHKYDKLFIPPKPRKGMEHFYKYIGKKFRFTKATENQSGKILLTFIIEKDGKISAVKVIKSAGADLDNEAIRLVTNYPEWECGFYRGQKGRFLFSIPITIKAAE